MFFYSADAEGLATHLADPRRSFDKAQQREFLRRGSGPKQTQAAAGEEKWGTADWWGAPEQITEASVEDKGQTADWWGAPEQTAEASAEDKGQTADWWGASAGQENAGYDLSQVLERAYSNVGEPEAPPRVSVADQLRELSSLKKEGILTEEEFREQKAKLLARM